MMDIKKWLRVTVVSLSFIPAWVKSQPPSKPAEMGWHRLFNSAISNDGKWVFFIRTYDDGKSEGVLQNTGTKQPLIIESAGKFNLDNQYFMVLNAEKELLVKNLTSGTEKIFEGVSDFDYDAASASILITDGSSVRLHYPLGNREICFAGIIKTENVKGTPCTFLWKDGEVLLLNRSKGTQAKISETDGSMLASIADPEKPNIKSLWRNPSGYWIRTTDYVGTSVLAPQNITIDTAVGSLSFLSEKTLIEKRPLLKIGSKTNDTVEVWSSVDKALKPRLMSMASTALNITLHNITEKDSSPKKYRNFTTEHYLVFNDTYVLEVSELENYDYKINDISPRPKIRLRNRKSDEIEMEVQEARNFYPSAKLGYILYFRGRDWYRYDVLSRKTVNLTSSLKADFYTFDRLNTEVLYPVASPWFSADYRFIYLTSKNDIWKYDVMTGRSVRITEGAAKNYTFKIIVPLKGGGVSKMKWHRNPILQTDYLALLMTDPSELRQGLALWKDERLSIISPPGLQSVTYLRVGEQALSYVIQNSNTPPKLIVYPFSKNPQKTMYDSGQEIDHAHFPRTELREWTDSRGEKTYTPVVLPPDYSPEKKYPSIIRVYENEAKLYTEFEFPTLRNPTGFNRALMAMEGYIVILPRITYSENRVGKSAVEAVEETVKKVQSWYSVDSGNIGIIGHSFGGYETNYILTQSSLFKTAVSGSGIADIISDYFTAHKMYLNSNISRYTNEQFGFTDGFFALKKEYLENNPILMADQITTPLLLWSGNRDEHVEWRQSVGMFMALSSLKKKVHLLLFPDDAHVLRKPKNQTEATQKILQWFGYYLKNGEKPTWF